jgi:HK97 family phage portal protein
MFERLKSFYHSMRGKTVSGIMDFSDRFSITEFRTYEDYLFHASKKVWASFRACDLTAQAVQTTAFNTFRKGGQHPVVVPGLQQLLSYPNTRETFADLLYITVFWLKITGSAYWYKSQATIKGDRPVELYGLNPKRVQIAVNGSGEVIGYIYRVAGNVITFDPEEIMHFRRPHPNNDYYGLGDFEAGGEIVSDFVNRQEWAKRFWKNGAAPASVLICEDQITDQADFEKIKARFHDEYGGQRNAGKTAFLTGKWKLEQIGLSPQEMQEIDRIKLSTEQIFQLHGVPLTVAGMLDSNRGLGSINTAEIDDQRFRLYTVYPLVRIIQDTMNTDLVSGWGDNLFIRFDVAGLINVTKVVENYGPLFDRGCITPNELREKAGLQKIDDPTLDQFYLQASYVPADLAGVSPNGGPTDQAATRIANRFTEKLLLGTAKDKQ